MPSTAEAACFQELRLLLQRKQDPCLAVNIFSYHTEKSKKPNNNHLAKCSGWKNIKNQDEMDMAHLLPGIPGNVCWWHAWSCCAAWTQGQDCAVHQQLIPVLPCAEGDPCEGWLGQLPGVKKDHL